VPKLIDHRRRRDDVGDAAWRVIRRDGVEAASVRAVAAEAQLSAGSLRHSFPTQEELLAFAMSRVVERIEARVATLDTPADPRAAVEQRLQQLLPLDDERRAENEVWLAFSTHGLARPEFRDLYRTVHDSLREACTIAATDLGVDDATLEGLRLHALIDGLAVHGALRPDAMTPDRITAVLAQHLDSLLPRV